MQHKTIQALKDMLSHHDLFLFSRKVLDLIADTDDMNMFQKGIDYTHQNIQLEGDGAAQLALAQQLFNEIEHLNIPTTDASGIILDAKNIKKSYGTGKFGLGPVSISISRGQVYGLVGENGNGKTTLLRILAKELAKDEGTLAYHLKLDNPKDIYELKTKLIYIPQRTEKWYGSLLDNLRFVLASYGTPASEIELRVLLMAARLGLWKYKDLQWSELSSGYKMRFELARTLLRKPQILFLDEPLANLDILSQQIILEDLKNICTSPKYPIALILSSQQLYEVEKVSDKIIFLKEGKYKDTSSSENSSEEQIPLVIEMDTNASREEISTVFEQLQPEQIQNNGGNIIIQFGSTVTFKQVLSQIANSNLEVIYIRNISSSTRRYFVA